MSLTKKTKDKKVNFEFNKEYIRVVTSKIANNGTVKPKVRFIKSCNKGFRVIKGFNCLGTEVTNVKTNLLTNDDNQIVVAKGITTNNPAIRSFLRSC